MTRGLSAKPSEDVSLQSPVSLDVTTPDIGGASHLAFPPPPVAQLPFLPFPGARPYVAKRTAEVGSGSMASVSQGTLMAILGGQGGSPPDLDFGANPCGIPDTILSRPQQEPSRAAHKRRDTVHTLNIGMNCPSPPPPSSGTAQSKPRFMKEPELTMFNPKALFRTPARAIDGEPKPGHVGWSAVEGPGITRTVRGAGPATLECFFR